MKIAKSGIVMVLSTVISFIVFGGVLVSESVAEFLYPYAAGAKEVSLNNLNPYLDKDGTADGAFGDKTQTVDEEGTVSESEKEREFIETEKIPEGSLPITSYTITPGDYLDGVDGVYIINEDNVSFSLEKLLEDPFTVKFEKNKEPEVLIVHTHATESYNEYYSDYYYKDNDYRDTDNEKNVVHIGSIVAKKLEEAGISVIHSEAQHDNPNYNKSYTNSNETIRKYLDQYSSIKLVLDIHRDTLISDNGTKYRPITKINGKDVAQIMLLMGAGNDTYPNEVWEKNLSLAANIQKNAQQLYPDLMRPILLRDSRYNQHLLAGSMLVEIGTCANTLEEAERAAEYFCEVLLKTLN